MVLLALLLRPCGGSQVRMSLWHKVSEKNTQVWRPKYEKVMRGLQWDPPGGTNRARTEKERGERDGGRGGRLGSAVAKTGVGSARVANWAWRNLRAVRSCGMYVYPRREPRLLFARARMLRVAQRGC